MKNQIAILAILTAICGPVQAAQLHTRSGGTLIPPAALAAGYTTNTYHAGPFVSGNIDLGHTYQSGYKLYLWNFFSENTPSGAVAFNSDGTISVSGSNYNLSSAAQISGSPFYVGTSFGCGGYITAELAFNAPAVNISQSWPAWWVMSIEHLAGLATQQWSGQVTGYSHFAEVDELEYLKPNTNPNTYSAAWHDWYGIFNTTCSGGVYCDVSPNPYSNVYANTPIGTDFTLFHRVAFLWVPATSASSGYIKYYFDDEPIGTQVTWTQFSNQSPPPTNSTPWTLGIIDQQHMTLIVNGSANVPMNIRTIDVWQNSGACNLSH
jgi:hypothetical protein